jgi:hypothetical protein
MIPKNHFQSEDPESSDVSTVRGINLVNTDDKRKALDLLYYVAYEISKEKTGDETMSFGVNADTITKAYEEIKSKAEKSGYNGLINCLNYWISVGKWSELHDIYEAKLATTERMKSAITGMRESFGEIFDKEVSRKDVLTKAGGIVSQLEVLEGYFKEEFFNDYAEDIQVIGSIISSSIKMIASSKAYYKTLFDKYNDTHHQGSLDLPALIESVIEPSELKVLETIEDNIVTTLSYLSDLIFKEPYLTTDNTTFFAQLRNTMQEVSITAGKYADFMKRAFDKHFEEEKKRVKKQLSFTVPAKATKEAVLEILEREHQADKKEQDQSLWENLKDKYFSRYLSDKDKRLDLYYKLVAGIKKLLGLCGMSIPVEVAIEGIQLLLPKREARILKTLKASGHTKLEVRSGLDWPKVMSAVDTIVEMVMFQLSELDVVIPDRDIDKKKLIGKNVSNTLPESVVRTHLVLVIMHSLLYKNLKKQEFRIPIDGGKVTMSLSKRLQIDKDAIARNTMRLILNNLCPGDNKSPIQLDTMDKFLSISDLLYLDNIKDRPFNLEEEIERLRNKKGDIDSKDRDTEEEAKPGQPILAKMKAYDFDMAVKLLKQILAARPEMKKGSSNFFIELLSMATNNTLISAIAEEAVNGNIKEYMDKFYDYQRLEEIEAEIDKQLSEKLSPEIIFERYSSVENQKRDGSSKITKEQYAEIVRVINDGNIRSKEIHLKEIEELVDMALEWVVEELSKQHDSLEEVLADNAERVTPITILKCFENPAEFYDAVKSGIEESLDYIMHDYVERTVLREYNDKNESAAA